MADQYKQPYVESTVLIDWIKGEATDNRGAIGEHVLKQAELGVYKVYTSAWTIAEVHKLRRGPVTPEEQADDLLAYFEHEWIEIVDVDQNIGEHAHRLARKHGITPGDAVHLACALKVGCDVLLTWDNRFANVQGEAVSVEKPELRGQAQMFPPEPHT